MLNRMVQECIGKHVTLPKDLWPLVDVVLAHGDENLMIDCNGPAPSASKSKESMRKADCVWLVHSRTGGAYCK